MKNNDGVNLINEERERQKYGEGYDPEQDKGRQAELVRAARSYLVAADAVVSGGLHSLTVSPPICWPWADRYWKPTNDVQGNLIKAGALTAAALDAGREV